MTTGQETQLRPRANHLISLILKAQGRKWSWTSWSQRRFPFSNLQFCARYKRLPLFFYRKGCMLKHTQTHTDTVLYESWDDSELSFAISAIQCTKELNGVWVTLCDLTSSRAPMPLKASGLCSKICHFGLRIILTWRQLGSRHKKSSLPSLFAKKQDTNLQRCISSLYQG